MVEDNELQMSYCADLLALEKFEAFPRTLFNEHQPGEWVQVEKLCQRTGIVTSGMKAELVATWLPDPLGDQTYAVIIFYDDETIECMAAPYNKGWLLDANRAIRPQGSPASGRE